MSKQGLKRIISIFLITCLIVPLKGSAMADNIKGDNIFPSDNRDFLTNSPLLLAQAPSNPLNLDPTTIWMAQSNATSQLNLDDLGFSKSETTQDPALQKLLNRRSKMLKAHQIMGLTTGVAMALALSKASGTNVKGDAGKDAREDHEKLGIATGVLYLTTAGLSIFAPEAPNEKKSGRTKIHKTLAFIHFPAMIGTMILGISDKKKLDRGEDPSGLKPAFATTAAVAFYTSLAVMVIPFGGKGDRK